MPLALAPWESFYVIAGGAGAALTGLMFVVVALAADRIDATSTDGFGAFSTPTVTHFAAVLLLAGVMTVPVQTTMSLTICLVGCALAGLFGSGLAGIRMRRLTSYTAGTDDWVWHVILPYVVYTVLLAAGLMLGPLETPALVIVAGVALVLLAIGIHNAWDVAVFLVASTLPTAAPAADAAPAEPAPDPNHSPAATLQSTEPEAG
jgi:modulator of FtsH protease